MRLLPLVVVLLVACSATPTPNSVGDSAGTVVPHDDPPADFTNWLNSYGQAFTAAPPPLGPENWRAAVADFPTPASAPVESAIYGVVTCFAPSRNCANRGLVRPGQTMAIWIVDFGDDADGCPVWATINAKTGAFVVGNAGPC